MTTPNDGQPTYAPGWYADTNAPGTERWYDGTSWTQHIRPIAPQQATAGMTQTVAFGAPTAQHAAAAISSYPGAPTSVAQTTTTAVLEPTGDQPSNKKGLKWWVWVLIAIGGVIVLSGIVSALNGGGSEEAEERRPAAVQEEQPATEEVVDTTVAVPSVVGGSIADARAAIEGAGFVIAVPEGAADDWIVLTQDISTPSEPGTAIAITAEAPKPLLTMGQEQAIASAKSYLAYTGFSRSGLVEQLEYEEFSTEDATFAVDYISPDWNAEAAESAKSYIEYTSFSRQGLIDQLLYEGFDQAQAEFGVAAVGY